MNADSSRSKTWFVSCVLIAFYFVSVQAAKGQLQYPIDLVSIDNEILVIDRTLPGLQKISGDGQLSVVIQASSKFRTPLNGIRCIVVGPEKQIIVGDSATRQLYRVTDGKAKPMLTNKTGIGVPYAMTFDGSGNLYVADLEPPGRIFKVPAGKTEPEIFAKQPGVRGLAIDSSGNLIALTGLDEALLKFSPDGERSVILKDRPFQFPNSIVAKGKEFFVADSYAKCIWKIDSAGKLTEFCKTGLTYPGGMSVQGDNLLVTDAKVKKIWSIAPDGTPTEVKVK